MRICIDSCVLINALQQNDPSVPIPDNRHFLRNLVADAFKVLDGAEFVARWQQDTL